MGKNGNLVSLIGRQFGDLTVLARAGSIHRFAAWRCICKCGKECVARGDKLRGGYKKSCSIGHYYTAGIITGITVLNSHEYNSWMKMNARCNNKNHKRYKHYGGRGITVCERWTIFANFLADMGPKPAPNYTIERNDVNGNYEPSNCRWATRQEQYRNMQRSLYVMYGGERRLLLDVATLVGIPRSVLQTRIKVLGWSVEKATTTPVRAKNKNRS